MLIWGRRPALGALTLIALALTTGSATAATVTVNSTTDELAPFVVNGNCSIREAIQEAQANNDLLNPDCSFNDETQPFGNDTINIPAGTYTLTGVNSDNLNATGDLDVTMTAGNGLTFTGLGANAAATVIDANDVDRVLQLIGTGTAALNNLTLTNGTAPAVEGAGALTTNAGIDVTLTGVTVSASTSDNIAGGILNGGTMTITGGSSVTGNTTATPSGNGGAGINSVGNLTISGGSSVTGNTITSPNGNGAGAGVTGGGVMERNNATLTVIDSTISGNTINSLDATKFPGGAGIGLTDANLVLQRSTISGNIAGGGTAGGGGIDFTDTTANNTLTIENSTLSGNAASSAGSHGGAITANKGLIKVANATFSNNTAITGRAIYWQKQAQADASVTLRGSLIQEDGTNECGAPQGPLTSAGYNIDRGTSCALATGTDQQSTTATLGSLGNNGGPTQTQTISGSVAVDDIPAAQCLDTTGSTLLTTDQRGVARPQGTDCDVGAYELGPLCNGQASTIVGTGSGETINGTSGADVIVAGDGADTVNAGDGADTICGGNGNDTIRTGTGNDSDTALGEGDTDTISFDDLSAGMTSANLATGTTSGTDAGVDTLSGFENLTGTPFADVSGSTGLTGNAAQNTIDGGGGNDTIQGLGDNDTLIGGSGTDTATWISLGPVNANLTAGTATGGQGSDTLSGFENLTGSSLQDTLTGDSSQNDLNGFSDNDVLDGRGDNDFLTGGPGTDTASFGGSAGPVTATLAAGALSATGQGTDGGNTLENLTGSPDGDTLTGDASSNVIDGGGGNDTLADGVTTTANPDSFVGGSGTDSVSYAARSAAVAVNLAGTVDNAGAAGENDDVAADVEGATGGSGADTLTGDEQPNPLSGGGGTDTVRFDGVAGAVNASLLSGAATGQGADTLTALENLVGSNQGDTLAGSLGDNTIDGGGGSDTASYAGLPIGVQATLTAGALSVVGGQGTDTGSSIENLTGSGAADTLTGDDNANVLTGGPGADQVLANMGADTLLIRDTIADTADCGADAVVDTVQADEQGTDTLTNCGAPDTIDFASTTPLPTGGGGTTTTTTTPTSTTPTPTSTVNPLCATLRAKLKRAKAAHNKPLIRKLRRKLRRLGC